MTSADPRLNHVRRGDPITAMGWNAIIDQVTSRPLPPVGTRPEFPVGNAAGVDIPPFAVLTADTPSIEAYTFNLQLTVKKPSLLTNQRQLQTLMTNGKNTIYSGKTGLVTFLDPWCPVPLIAGGTISAWDVVGPENSFQVTAGNPGFLALHAASANGVVWCISDVNHNGWIAAKTTSAISALSGTTPGSGTADLKYGTSTLATAESVTIRNIYESTILTDTWVTVSRDLLGDYWVLGANCT